MPGESSVTGIFRSMTVHYRQHAMAKISAELLYAAAGAKNAVNAQKTKDWLTLILTTTPD
jgi:hypothetical protein